MASSGASSSQDVFLSFSEGKDARKELIDHLCKSPNAFFHFKKEQYDRGESIVPYGDELLLQMAAASQVAIIVVVFPKNFSRWLDDQLEGEEEEEEIIERNNATGQKVLLQIFYNPEATASAKHYEIWRANLNKRAPLISNLLRFSSTVLALDDCQRVAYNTRRSISICPFHFNEREELLHAAASILRWSGTGRTFKTSQGLLINSEAEYDHPNTSNLLYMNSMKSGSFTTRDNQRILVPNCGDIDVEIEQMLRQAGALRARDLASNHDAVYHWKERREYQCSVLLLLMATLILAKITYQAASTLLAGTPKDIQREGYSYNYINYAANSTLQLKRRPSDSINVTRSFILFNSTGFVASLTLIIFLLHDHEFPLKPWPQISVYTLFGSYMCLIMATSPGEALPLLLLTIPFILLAAKLLHGVARPPRSPPN